MNHQPFLFKYKDITVTFEKQFEDEKEFAYACFLEALIYELDLMNKTNGLSRLITYFKKDNLWYMDILYATAIASKDEKELYKQILDIIDTNISIDMSAYITIMYEIINGMSKDIEHYLHTYTCVEIPNIVNGNNK